MQTVYPSYCSSNPRRRCFAHNAGDGHQQASNTNMRAVYSIMSAFRVSFVQQIFYMSAVQSHDVAGHRTPAGWWAATNRLTTAKHQDLCCRSAVSSLYYFFPFFSLFCWHSLQASSGRPAIGAGSDGFITLQSTQTLACVSALRF